MRARYRAALLMLVLGLLAHGPVVAQHDDTVRVDEQTDSGAVTGDSSASNAAAAAGDQDTTDVAAPVLRTIADSMASGWRKDRAYAYANDPEYWKPRVREEKSDGSLSRALGTDAAKDLLLCVLGAILIFAIARIIIENKLQLFYRSPRRLAATGDPKAPSPIEDDLEGQLQHYLQIRDYRQAVRYLYLKSLRLLNDRGLIAYHQEATNREYSRQLGETPQAAPFRNLTMIYEKVWYGEFPLADPLFQRLHQYFEDFYKTVRA